jgi:hypothetical protein
MSFEINLSLNGRHLFATHKRSMQSVFEVPEVYRIIAAKFPASEGFGISLTEMPEIHYGADMEKVDLAIAKNDLNALSQLFRR